MRETSETSGTMLNAPTLNHMSPGEEDRKKGHEKILEEVIVENVPKTGKEIAT